LAHCVKSNDELVGNAVEDDIVGRFIPATTVREGDNNVTKR